MNSDSQRKAPATVALTLLGVKQRLADLGYAASTRNDVERALQRAKRVYNLPLNRILADTDAFDRHWDRRADFKAFRFRSAAGFDKWKSYVRGAIKRTVALGKPSPAGPIPEAWDRIYEYVALCSGFGRRFGKGRELTLCVLVNSAQSANLHPSEVTAEWLQSTYDQLRYERRKAFRRGVLFLNDLIQASEAHSEISADLPPSPLVAPQYCRGKLFGGAVLPVSLHADVKAFLEWYMARGRDSILIRVEQPSEGANSATAYRSAISWLVRELVESQEMAPDQITDLSAICTYDRIFRAAQCFAERRQDERSGLKETSSSLHSYVSKVSFVARHWVKVSEAESNRLTNLCKDRAVKTERVGRIAEDRERFVIELLADAEMRDTITKLPDILMQKADVLLGRWDEADRSQRMLCLRLAVAATQMALLLRSSPMRPGNLLNLTFRGEGASLILPGRSSALPRLSIPGEMVKNGRPLDTPVARTTTPILERFLNVFRPRLIVEHPYGKNAADSDYVFPGTSAEGPMDRSVFASCFAEGVEAVGLRMTAHQCRHVVAALVLRKYPDRIQMVADWLGDDPETVRRFYSVIDTYLASERSQKHMEEMLVEARRSTRPSLARKRGYGDH